MFLLERVNNLRCRDKSAPPTRRSLDIALSLSRCGPLFVYFSLEYTPGYRNEDTNFWRKIPFVVIIPDKKVAEITILAPTTRQRQGLGAMGLK